MSDGSFDARMARVESLLAEIESSSDAPLVERTRELVATILELHRAGLERLALRLEGSTEAVRAASALRRDDPLVDSLFELHGIALGEPAESPPPHPELVQLRVKKPVVEAAPERCERCGAVMSSAHEHLFEKATGKLECACAACAVAGAVGHVRVPHRIRYLPSFELADDLWDALGIPVQLAFLTWSSHASRPLARYPSPAGAIESPIDAAAWDALAARNPVLRSIEADVEALLVWRTDHAREHFLVPIDVGFELSGLVRKEGSAVIVSRAATGALAESIARLKARAEAFGA